MSREFSTVTPNRQIGFIAWLFIPSLLMAYALSGCGPSSAALAEGGEAVGIEDGRRIFIQHCSSCHSTSADQVIVGPSMAGIADRAADRVPGMQAEAYLRASVERPGEYLVEGYSDLMPPTLADSMSDRELDALIDYLLLIE